MSKEKEAEQDFVKCRCGGKMSITKASYQYGKLETIFKCKRCGREGLKVVENYKESWKFYNPKKLVKA
jgi:ribosomal protein L37E